MTKLEKELREIGLTALGCSPTERELTVIRAFAAMLAHVAKTPTRKKKADLPKGAMSAQSFHAALQEEIGVTVPYSSGQQFGWLGRRLAESGASPDELAGLIRAIATEQYPWYAENGHAFTMSTVNKNFNRWLEQYRAGPVKSTRKQEELKIK